MYRHYVLSTLIFLMLMGSVSAQKTGIGLALSGGGAKGLTHIGILQALDSAGLKVDYVTGTSMGSIIGGLYAAGYSGKQIETIARNIEWNSIFYGKPSFRNVSIEEKKEFQAYAIELPIENGGIKIPSAMMEAEELWLVLGEMFFPVYDQKDFSRFSIPFRCIAADLSTGEAVVLDHGEIVKAVRSSMAIPSVFTAIDHKETKLVDGGVVRNFPVSDLHEMGANFCIGVNLNRGLDPADKLSTSLDVLLQISFFRDNLDFEKEKNLCDILIEPPLGTYSAASFSSSDDLIRIGIETGRQFYPVFKRMADSLAQLGISKSGQHSRIPKVESLMIDSISVTGLKLTTVNYFKGKMNLQRGKAYSASEITEAIRKTYGSRRYNRIAFFFEPTRPGHANLKLEVIENPAAFIKAGIHYNTSSDFSAILALNFRDVLIKNSNSIIKANIGNTFRLFFAHTQPLFNAQNNLFAELKYDRMDRSYYKDFIAQVVYNTRFLEGDIGINHQFSGMMNMGLGLSLSSSWEQPKVDPVYNIQKENTFWGTYVFLNRNTLDRKHYPQTGLDLYVKASWIFAQHARLDSLSSDLGKQPVELGDYFRFDGKASLYKPLSPLSNLRMGLQYNMNLEPGNSYLDDWRVGGLTDFLHNQLSFAGLMENQLSTQSVAVLDANYRYQLTSGLFLNTTANVALHSFLGNSGPINATDNFLSGYGFGASYDSPIGPLELSVMYCDQAKKLYSYINLGFHF